VKSKHSSLVSTPSNSATPLAVFFASLPRLFIRPPSSSLFLLLTVQASHHQLSIIVFVVLNMLVPLPGSTMDLQSAISSAGPALLSLLAALVGILAFRFAFIWVVKSVFERPTLGKHVDQEGQATKPARYWEMFTLDSLPVSLVPPQTGVLGRGVGVSAPGLPMQRPSENKQNWQPFKGRSSTASRPRECLSI
jgi:hypothetical protein